MNVTPGRFSDKTEREDKLYSVNWDDGLSAGQSISNAQWWSEPTGLVLLAQTIVGSVSPVRIQSGQRGQTYRVRHSVTVSPTGEVLEITHNGQPGITLQITGQGRSGSDYSRSQYG